ncbi:odorant receptor Or2-like [Cryptotermes secundus]|uniref:odorant receptor Or2-like n=1 Tax=Cryptotermes secundus TaxID=105785 RepID=UPI001454C33C|nr:odorant receptor Or2-like [Cryptotermes secundus]
MLFLMVLSCWLHSILAMFLSIYHDIEDLNEVVDAAMFFIISSAASCTQLYFRFRRATLVRTLRLTDAFIWEDLPHTDPDTGSRAMTAWIPRIQRFTTLIIGAAVIVNGTKNLMLIFSSDNHSMVYHTWYPFDTAKSPTYELINIAQVIATIQWACFFYGVPSTYATLVCIACSQLEKLRANLLNIRQVFDTPAQESRAETGRNEGRQVQTSQEVFCRMQEQLNDCIRHHQLIIQFIHAIEEMFSPYFAGYFFILMGGLCITAYTAVLRWGNPAQLSESVLVYVLLSITVFVFCWFGSELSHQAERVREAAWGCDWVGTPLPFMRCLSFVIKMANKELALTAGKFVPVSKATMMNMMQESISLFMFLLQIKEKEETLEGPE